MADSNSWTEGWVNAQQQFWNDWSEMARKTMQSKNEPSPGMWAEGLDQWWKAVSPGTPAPVQDLYDKLLGMGKGYFSMAEHFGQAANQQDSALEAINEWLENLQNSFTQMSGGFPIHADKGMRDFMAFWELPLDTLQRTASSMSPFPGDFNQAFHANDAAKAADEVRDHLNRFLSTPAVGYSRESQEQYQKVAQLILEYQAALQAYKLAFAQVAVRSIQAFQKKINEIAADPDAKKIESMREYYDIWVDICEEVYAEFAMSKEYQTLYGRVVNTLMAVKRHIGLIVDEVMEAFNMPSRSEINALERRQTEIHRENLSLRRELSAIKEQLGEMVVKKQATKNTTAKKSPTTKRKTTTRKTTTKTGTKSNKKPAGGNKS